MNCTECHKEEAEWDFKDVQLCQMCFEAWTSELWWASLGGVYETPEYVRLLEG
uniref:Uncharacterized protein n=1 Tax=viral metagenome TaxID=1070528 RepID=A0A6M3JV47_9ZZZZ